MDERAKLTESGLAGRAQFCIVSEYLKLINVVKYGNEILSAEKISAKREMVSLEAIRKRKNKKQKIRNIQKIIIIIDFFCKFGHFIFF